MNEIDVFKLGCELGFDIRGAELADNINSLIIVDESRDTIYGFNSNKVIAYNCRKDINIKRNSVALHLQEYIKFKSNEENVYLVNINKKNCIMDIGLLAEQCIQNGLIENQKILKKLYK